MKALQSVHGPAPPAGFVPAAVACLMPANALLQKTEPSTCLVAAVPPDRRHRGHAGDHHHRRRGCRDQVSARRQIRQLLSTRRTYGIGSKHNCFDHLGKLQKRSRANPVVCHLCSVEPAFTIQLRNGTDQQKRSLIIKDDSNKSVEVPICPNPNDDASLKPALLGVCQATNVSTAAVGSPTAQLVTLGWGECRFQPWTCSCICYNFAQHMRRTHISLFAADDVGAIRDRSRQHPGGRGECRAVPHPGGQGHPHWGFQWQVPGDSQLLSAGAGSRHP